MANDTVATLDINVFIDSLIEEMDLQNEVPEDVKELRDGLMEQVKNVILNAISLNIEPEVMEAVLERYKNVSDITLLITEFIAYSFDSQVAILEDLEKFREDTLSAYNQFKQA
jgi:hypothetical protein